MNFIYENDNSLSEELCNDIIELYENDDRKYDGITQGGLQKKIKNTTDLIIPKNNEKWEKIEKCLYKELHKNILKYIKHINCESYNPEFNNGRDANIFKNKNLEAPGFMIQKYEKNVGEYVYHDDFSIENNKHRIITFLWYLNDVEEGGETQFWDSYKIKPKTGKLILFPSWWTYQHRGLMPKSNNKYILTNWLYLKKYEE
jgi:hypothetical protein